MITSTKCFVYFIHFVLIAAFSAVVDEHTTTSLNAPTSLAQFLPYKYQRIVLFFFSEDATVDFFKGTMRKLFELDDYCGGENLGSTIFDQNINKLCSITWCTKLQNTVCALKDAFSNFFVNVEYCYPNSSKAWNVSAGNIDQNDVSNVSTKLLQSLNTTNWEAGKLTMDIISQIVLITDYATDTIAANNNIWKQFKLQNNITFVALTSNLTNATSTKYFPNDVWSVASDYLNWTPDSGIMNPICGYKIHPYTTPSLPFSGYSFLYIYPFFSSDFTKKTRLDGVVELLNQLANRRWLDPCRQFRALSFVITLPNFQGCVVDSDSENAELVDVRWCSKALFRDWLSQLKTVDSDQNSLSCGSYFDAFFTEILNSNLNEKKFLLITDLSLPCNCNTNKNFTFNTLENYSYDGSGAPLTIIAVDKINDNSVFNSYKPLFPPTQLSNLYQVNDIAEILSNISTVINFCLNSAPWFSNREIVPQFQAMWYFYIIGATILMLMIILITIVIILLKRKRKQDEALRQIRNLERNPSSMSMHSNQYGELSNPAVKDIWEVSIESLDIDYKNLIGKGAFSVVYSGILHGKAPVLDLFPLIALQHFEDCEVAIKTVPQHCNDCNKAKFRSEIELMKEIGYHIHLVGLLGCNCSIERPILLMELAEQDLLHWLAAQYTETMENETSLGKTLLSISWQISDGMSFLSSKHFVHRDLAARNVLLNAEMKAMVSDFGLCQKCADEEVLVIPGGRLPLKWMALESLQEQKFSTKTDVWSFGILLFEIFSLGQEPYQEVPTQKLTAFLVEGKRLSKRGLANDAVYDLMRQCWNDDPAQRPQFSRIQLCFAEMLEDSNANYGYLTTIEKAKKP